MIDRASVKLNNLLFLIKAKLDERMVLFAVGSVVIWLYGDVVLGWIGTILHYVIEVLELGLEHLIHSLFHVSRHTAQIMTAWTGLFIFLVLGWFVFRLAAKSLGKRIASWMDNLNRYQPAVPDRRKLAIYASLLTAVFFVLYLQF